MESLQGYFVQRRWTVSAAEAGLRLDAFLRARLPFLSRRELERAIGEGCFLIKGRPTRKGARLLEGDAIEYRGPALRLADAPVANPDLQVPVIYEDDSLIALNKPAGMDCHGFSGRDHRTLANFVVARWPELVHIGNSPWEPGLVHRIDRDTSGLVLAAKTEIAFAYLRGQFRRHAVQKTYLALVHGSAPAHGTITWPLAHDPSNRRKMRAIAASDRARGRLWPAVTDYRKISEAQGLSLLRLEMQTGVTHQLRVHLAAAGYPIVGDLLYGSSGEESFGLARHFLHAVELRFRHPVSRSAMALSAPLAPELRLLLECLEFPPGWLDSVALDERGEC
jgi:23S rRNA pseudouridine1911/1915/1917 synthase